MRFMKLAAAVFSALAGVTILVGCGSLSGANEGAEGSGENIAVIYGRHSNSAADPALLGSSVKSAVGAKGKIEFIRLDGSPVKVDQGAFELEDGMVELQSKNKKNLEAEIAAVTESMIEDLSGDAAVAQSPEVDILSAFGLASRGFSGAEGKNVVVISDPGISTAGVVNLTEIGLEPDADSFVAWATEEGVLPNLSNIDEIVWYCFGDVAAPQPKPKPATIENLKTFWRAVLAASGFEGELVFDDAAPGNVSYAPDLPAVTVVDVPDVSPYAGQVVELREDGGVHFNPDEDTFIDEAAVEDTLAEYVEWLSDPALVVHVQGYVSHSTNTRHGEGELAALRANAVKAKLVQMGVPEAQVIVDDTGKGLGPYEYGENGKSDSEIDALNRFVLLSFEQAE